MDNFNQFREQIFELEGAAEVRFQTRLEVMHRALQ